MPLRIAVPLGTAALRSRAQGTDPGFEHFLGRPTSIYALTLLALRTLARRKARTALTILGVSVGVATVVALVAVSRGMTEQFDSLFDVEGSHLVGSKRGAADPFFSYLPEELVGELEAHPSVEAAHPYLMAAFQVPGQPIILAFGLTAGSPALEHVRLVRGQELFDGADDPRILLGARAAEVYDLDVGDELELAHATYRVTGIFSSPNQLFDAGAAFALALAQAEAGIEGRMTEVLLTIPEERDPAEVEAELEQAFETLEVTGVASFTDAFEEFDLMGQAVLALSILASVIGGIGVMNTMLMSVLERTREIGVLQAVGWSRWMILRLILAEAACLCLLSAPVGVLLGILGVEALSTIGHMSWMSGAYGPSLFLWAAGVGLGMGLVGAAYPAWRATRIPPVEALRYE